MFPKLSTFTANDRANRFRRRCHRAGVSGVTLHCYIETTNTYVEIDLEMKRKTLQSAEKLLPPKGKRGSSWRDDDKLLSWLAKL